MSLTITRVLGVAIGGFLAAASVSSCVANNASLIILGMLTPPQSSGSGGSAICLYTPTITGPFLSFGTMDVAFSEEYIPTLLLGNQLIARGNASTDLIETDNIIIQGAIVRVTDATGATLDNYTAPGDGFILPSSGGSPGLSTFATTLVSPKAADAVRQSFGGQFGSTKRLISYVKVFGITTGGTHIESGEVGIPVNACNGCLVVFPAGSDDLAQAASNQPNCSAAASSGGSTSTPCIFGQDQYIDCRLCQGNLACDPKRP
jgi:hypothetical protein